MLPSGNVAQKRHMTCLCLLDFDPKIFHILGFCRGRSTPFYAVLRRSTPFYAALRRSTPFYAVLRRSTSDSQPPPQTVGHSPPPVLPNSRKYFSKIQFFQKKIKMTPPRFVHWAHMSNKFAIFCSRLSVGEKWAAWFFKIARARARARARTGPRASRAQNQGRHAQIAPFYIFSTFCIFGTS